MTMHVLPRAYEVTVIARWMGPSPNSYVQRLDDSLFVRLSIILKNHTRITMFFTLEYRVGGLAKPVKHAQQNRHKCNNTNQLATGLCTGT
jgi:hypothetical protein